QPLEALLCGAADGRETSAIAQVCSLLATLLRSDGLSAHSDDELERHAYAVNAGIADASLRNLHVLAAV
ncbi:MAG: hypothetical protein K6G54_07780, partial [Oscillospiraceae bacterium]|nr:hypothetical protein [Oscillospiraceae bacterium]